MAKNKFMLKFDDISLEKHSRELVRFHEIGDESSALEYYRTLYNEFEYDQLILHRLGKIALKYQSLKQSEKIYRKLLEINPDDLVYENNLALTLSYSRSDDKKALELFEKLLASNPKDESVLINASDFFNLVGKYDESFILLKKLRDLLGEEEKIGWRIGENLLLLKDYEKAKIELEESLKNFPESYYIKAYLSIVYKELDEEDNYKKICCEELVSLTCMSKILGEEKSKKYCRNLANFIKGHEFLSRGELRQFSTKKGNQTLGNLLLSDSLLVKELEPIILKSIELRRRELEGPSEKYRISAWGVSLKNGGHQSSHVHLDGKISGVIHLEVPEYEKIGDGDLLFGVHPEKYGTNTSEGFLRVPSVVGQICLFPSYFWHRTVPFKSKKKRVSLAFDAIPTR